METASERKDGVLVVTLNGRFDAFGASRFDEAIRTAVTDADTLVVLDLVQVPYLSSGGIRSLISLDRTLKKRGGNLHLAGIADYPRQVLEMAGMDQLFTIHATREKAIETCTALLRARKSERDWDHLPHHESHNARFTIFEASRQPSRLSVAGNLQKVLHATLERQDIVVRRFSETEYSIGLGAMGGTLQDCLPVFGEMITIGGTLVWLPTDGNDTPDFFTPQKDTGAVLIYTGLNVALKGSFNDIIVMEDKNGAGQTLSNLYASLFEIARAKRTGFKGLVSVAMVADLAGLCSSGVKISPVMENRPDNSGTIMDASNSAQWMAVNTTPRFAGKTMASFGVGLDLTADYSILNKAALDNVFYLNPANIADKNILLHNHGVIFEHLPWTRTLELDGEIRRIVSDGQFLDMRHLLDTTSVSRATIGVSYITDTDMENSAI